MQKILAKIPPLILFFLALCLPPLLSAQTISDSFLQNLLSDLNEAVLQLQPLQSELNTQAAQIASLQADLAAVPQEFTNGTLGLSYSQLHRMPSGPEGLFILHCSFAVGGGPSTLGSFSWIPAFGASPAQLLSTPIGESNLYCWEDLPLPAQEFKHLSDIRAFSMTANQQAQCQALEFESQFTWGGFVHNMAWQMDFHEHVVRYFNFSSKAWLPTSIPLPDFTHGPVAIAASFDLDGSTTTHTSLTINGAFFDVGIVQMGTPTTAGNKFTHAVQLDAVAQGLPTGVTILQDEVRFAY